MSRAPHPKLQVSVLALIVLYRQTPSESGALCSLIQILNANPDLAEHFWIVIYDNSPQSQAFEAGTKLPVLYKHDPTNAGLAAAYNFGLAHASKEQYEWLLLLDQDTSLTDGFLTELVACAERLHAQSEIASIVPKLLVNDKIYSPATPFLYQLRHQHQRSNHAVSRQMAGAQRGKLSAYNSGAALRVSALQAIGGFPEEYWLDFLDHAVFHALSVHGYHMYVMHSEIEHNSSQASVTNVPAWRQRNLLVAQSRFVQHTGSVVDRLLYRIWLLRYSRILWIQHPDKRLWKEALSRALSLGTGAKLASDHHHKT